MKSTFYIREIGEQKKLKCEAPKGNTASSKVLPSKDSIKENQKNKEVTKKLLAHVNSLQN